MVVLITLVVYKVTLLAIGMWASSRTRDKTDFFLGGRGLGPFVSGLSYAASTSSAWVLLGFSGFVYAVGLSALWLIPGIWAGYAVVWLWFGPRLHRDSQEYSFLTLTDFIVGPHQGKQRALLALTATVLILFCFIFYIAAQFDASAKALTGEFDLNLTEAVIIGAVIVSLYSILGGFWAVSVTDTLRR